MAKKIGYNLIVFNLIMSSVGLGIDTWSKNKYFEYIYF